MLLVMQGDVLRSELSFQNSREEVSDIPSISQATHRALEQTVSHHNMLVNAHPELARIDRMLKGPDVDVTPVRHGELQKIIANAEERALISKQAAEAMNMVSDEFQYSSSPYQRVAQHIESEIFPPPHQIWSFAPPHCFA